MYKIVLTFCMIGELMILIKNYLRIIMDEKYVRVTELAKQTGLSRTTITALKENKAKMIQLNTINKLCQALEVTPGDFFEYESELGR